MRHLLFSAGLILALSVAAPAQEAAEDKGEVPMTPERLGEIVLALDPEATAGGPGWQLRVAGATILLVMDPSSDRMRAMVPIRGADDLPPEDLERMMQANFDTALDGRYAIANGIVWAAFIHPLESLEKNQLISGIGQIVNLASSYGTLYSGGALQFGAGDSGALQRDLIRDLLKKGEEI